MKKLKPILLILEGLDRTGKTTLGNYINKKTDYRFIILDRGPIGYKAYCEIYGKENKADEYDKLEEQLGKVSHLCVYLHANHNILQQRFKETNEPPLRGGMVRHQRIYDKYYNESTLNKIKLDSGKMGKELLFNEVMNYLERLEEIKGVSLHDVFELCYYYDLEYEEMLSVVKTMREEFS